MSQIHVWPLLKQTFAEWSEDKCSKMAGSLAYFTATSIAPLIVATVGVLTLVARRYYTSDKLEKLLAGLTDKNVAATLSTAIEKPSTGHAGLLATIIGIALAVFSASALFAELQDSLNTIWEVKPKPGRGILGIVKDRTLSMGMVMGIAFLLLLSTVLTSVITGLPAAFFGDLFGSAGVTKTMVGLISFFTTTGVVTVLFASIFKLLPDVKVKWRDVWIGALLTALLFQVGKLLLSLYITKTAPGSAFGAAGSIVVSLVWVYYSAWIMFLGAEFTQVYANQYGSHIVPADNAVPLTEEMRAQAGIAHRPDSPSHPDNFKPNFKPPIPAAKPVARQPARHGASTAGKAIVFGIAPVAVGVVLGRFAWLRRKAHRPDAGDLATKWATAGHKWGRVAKLLVASKGDRYALTHGPDGDRGPTWSDLSHDDKTS